MDMRKALLTCVRQCARLRWQGFACPCVDEKPCKKVHDTTSKKPYRGCGNALGGQSVLGSLLMSLMPQDPSTFCRLNRRTACSPDRAAEMDSVMMPSLVASMPYFKAFSLSRTNLLVCGARSQII